MDGEDLIICLAIWTLYKHRPPLTCDGLLAVSIASRNKLRSTSLLEAILRVFEAILGGFRRPKLTPNMVFRRFFGDVFFDSILASILHGSKTEKSLSFHRKINDFHKFDVIGKVSKNSESWLRFRTRNRGKVDKQGIENHAFFRM